MARFGDLGGARANAKNWNRMMRKNAATNEDALNV